MEISEVKEIVEKVFSKDGYEVNNFTFFCPKSLSISLEKTSNDLSIKFNTGLPSVQTKKLFIPITAQLEGITLGEDGGSIKLKYFPDIKFSYGYGTKSFGAYEPSVDVYEMKHAINKQFPDPERNKIANLALQYAQEWISVASQNGTNLLFKNKNLRKQHRKNCEAFVKENIMLSKDIEAKSAVLTFILVYFILPAVISWVVKKILDNYFN